MKKSTTIGLIAGSAAAIIITCVVVANKKKKKNKTITVLKANPKSSDDITEKVDADVIKMASTTMTVYMARTEATNDAIFGDDTTMWLRCTVLVAANHQKYMRVQPSDSTGLGGGTIVVGENAATVWGLYPTPLEAEAASQAWMSQQGNSWITNDPTAHSAE